MTSENLFRDPPKPAPSSSLNLRAKPESIDALKAKAARKGMTLSAAMREALRDWMLKP